MVVPTNVKQTADIAADKLMRLCSNHILYGAPPPYTGIGRPRVHGGSRIYSLFGAKVSKW